jgi:hypothetical protein
LGDFIAISNLINDEPVRGSFLPSVEEGQANTNGAIAEGGDEDRDPALGSGSENGPFVLEVTSQDLQISSRGDDLLLQSLGNLRQKVDDPVDFMIIHQGIVNTHDPMSPESIIISFFGAHIMPVPKIFEEVVENIGTRGDNHIDQFHADHIGNHLAHATWDHGSGEAQENDALRIFEHLPEDFKASVDISALKGGMLEGLNQVEKALNSLEV